MLYSICKRIPALNDWYFEYWYFTPMHKWCRNVSAYIINRWIDKSHLVRLPQIEKGDWMETDQMMFHAVFQLLVNFVEYQCAQLEKIQDPDSDDLDPVVRQWHRIGMFKRWLQKHYWNEQLGMAHLRWAGTLDDPSIPEFQRMHSQAETARRTLELYQWYKWERDARPDPHDEPFIGEKYHGGEDRFEDIPLSPVNSTGPGSYSRMREITKEYRDYLTHIYSEEERNANEDTRRAQQLLEIRRGLWT